MSKIDRVAASHILIMHKESQDSRSNISKDEAEKKIKNILKDIKEKNNFC